MNRTTILIAIAATLLVGACVEETRSARTNQILQSEQAMAQAEKVVGPASLTEFQERDFAVQIMKARDSSRLGTYVYTQGLDGRLVCLGRALGYGLPYGVQTTPPEKVVRPGSYDGGGVTVANPEPNGLYMPDSAEASWVRIIGPDGKPTVMYAEQRLLIVPFQMRGAAVAVACPNG